jgi:myo-inositol-1(or 4)-monophosphatase
MRHFGRDLAVTWKSPDQPVTAADLEADRLLYGELVGPRPAYGWLSEESADRPDRLARRRVWIVDPIDGRAPSLQAARVHAVHRHGRLR